MVTQQNKTSIRILIVDDTAQVRQDLRTLLPLLDKEAGVNLEVVGKAADGWAAVRMAAALKPDVVLMDLAMPVLDGFAATMKIKAGNPLTRVVILTVYNAEGLREKAEIAGADDFVEKGAPLNRLYNAIASRAISEEN